MTRTSALDNFRTVLTILVIAHHAALPYGGAGTWLYVSPHHFLFSSASLLLFNMFNQTFFMGAFFLLSGYFSSISAARKSRSAFLKDKARRLGVPMGLYSVFAPAVIMGVLARERDSMEWDGVWGKVVEGLRMKRGVNGPVWYCALLIIFDFCYVVLRPCDFGSAQRGVENEGLEKDKRVVPGDKDREISTAHVLVALCLTSLAAFLLRFPYPVGVTIQSLNITIGYTPQYILSYTWGIYIHRHLHTEPHKPITRRTELVVLSLSLAIIAIGYAAVQIDLSQPGSTNVGPIVNQARGGANKYALLYALANEFVGFSVSMFLLKLFASSHMLRMDWKPCGFNIARYSYVAFLVHAPVTVYLQCLCDMKGWSAEWKTVLVSVLGAVGSWGVGWCVKVVVEICGFRGYV